MRRTTVETHPIVLKAMKIIAIRRGLKVKQVADAIHRYGIPRENEIFGPPKNSNNRKDDGK